MGSMTTSFDSIVKSLKLSPTPQQVADCTQAEKIGLRFCVDYGLDNAAEMIDTRMNEWLNATPKPVPKPKKRGC